MVNIEYTDLVEYIKRKISFDAKLYKEKPFKRRIAIRMRRTHSSDYADYLTYLKTHSDELEKLKNTITINVTRFFRNKETFDYMESYIENDLLKRKKSLHLLSIGCSSGEEPYSMAIILENLKRRVDFTYKIIAIDIDTKIIKKAQLAQYNSFSLSELNDSEIDKYFDKNDDIFLLKKIYRDNVYFKNMDIKNHKLLKDFGFFDIIMCRNVLIYFSKDFQGGIISTFNDILYNNGILILGKIEILISTMRDKYIILNKRERVYRKNDNKSKNG